MKTIKDLKKMIAQPASKHWFAKHGSPKQKALGKMTDRDRQIKETNERVHTENMKDVWKDRHERRHHGAKGTTLGERQEWVKKISKE